MRKLLNEYIDLAAYAKENLNYKEAIRLLNIAYLKSEEIDKIDILFELGDLYSEIGDFDEGKLTYETILKIDEDSPGAWYGLGFTNELSGGELMDSIKYYERAIKLDPEYVKAYYYAAILYDDLGYREKAISYYEKIIELDSKFYLAYNDLGSIYESEGDYDKALYYLNKALEINDTYYLSYFNRGVVYKALNNNGEALKNYERAAEYSDYEYIFLNISAIYIEDKNYKGAIEILTRGLERRSSHILLYNRACSHRLLGNIEEALRDMEEARNIDKVVMDWASKDPDLMDLFTEEL